MILRYICLLLLLTSFHKVYATEPERAVVQIINFSQQPDWIEPWRFSHVRKSTGSGFLINDGRIMTNAHVVSWSKKILVRRYQDPKPYPAVIEHIGHDCDLAVLKVTDPSFYKDLEPLEIGELPTVRSSVTTYGYPAGGQQISYTRGVISRIEVQQYAHIVNRSMLTVQTDAAINPGNSGGPAIQDDRVVGVSFQGNPRLENAGFFIPPNIIRHFLTDIEDGTYHGFPDAGIALMSLDSPAFREALKLPDNSVGARVDQIYHPFPSTHELIKENDVLLSISGYEVGSDAMVQYKGNRVHVAVIFDAAQHGDTLDMVIWRNGERIEISLPVYKNNYDRLTGNQYDKPPPYVMSGGLVFTELSRNLFGAFGNDWKKNFDTQTIYELHFRLQQSEAKAKAVPIVLSKVLKHPTNIDFGVEVGKIVKAVNGKQIESLQDLYDALANETGAYHRFEFLDGHYEALDRDLAEQATLELMQSYNIPQSYRLELNHD